jgi:nucleoside 2-deoxyribosyltransferase
MKVYISVSVNKRKLLVNEVTAMVETVKKLKDEPFLFTGHYKFDLILERQMMKQAMVDIDRCSVLIAETSFKEIGIGIEAGYAKAKGKKVIYVRQKKAEHSTTVSGISDFQIAYNDCNDLKKQLEEIINAIHHNLPQVSNHY